MTRAKITTYDDSIVLAKRENLSSYLKTRFRRMSRMVRLDERSKRVVENGVGSFQQTLIFQIVVGEQGQREQRSQFQIGFLNIDKLKNHLFDVEFVR